MDQDLLDSLNVNINSIAKELRKDSRSIRNRLQSILSDYKWIKQVQNAYQRPLVPNERCGLWYVPPELRLDSAYFKSTDGHTTQWNFSTRRLNFHLLPLMSLNNGLIIVDSTRRGKKMPDALSKSIPIWCAVLNYIMFGENDTNWLYLPPDTVSDSEASQIMKLIPTFVENMTDLQLISKEKLLAILDNKPIRPIWIYPGMLLPFESPVFEDFNPVICCTASHMVQDGMEKQNDFYYVQGAADDHELWAGKLTPELFWKNRDTFSNKDKSDQELMEYVQLIVEEKERLLKSWSLLTRLDVSDIMGTNISVGTISQAIDYAEFVKLHGNVAVLIILSEFFDCYNVPKAGDSTKENENSLVLIKYNIESSKKGSNKLRGIIPELVTKLEPSILKNEKVVIVCDTGKDISIGLLLVFLCKYFDINWKKLETPNGLVSKDLIKRHLAKILEIRKVNPSRSTLQSINSFLM